MVEGGCLLWGARVIIPPELQNYYMKHTQELLE